jgi:D-lactate dehydrogenase
LNTPALENDAEDGLLNHLRAVVGKRHVLIGLRRTARFRKRFASGESEALVLARRGRLLEQ